MDAFTKYKVVPDLIDDMPGGVLKVQFDGKDLGPGEQWTPTDVRHDPVITWDADPGSFYNVMLLDPDAGAKFKDVLHMMIANIPGNQMEKGDEYGAYIGPGLPEGTGPNRYVFLLFKQPDGKIEYDHPKDDKHSMVGRQRFNTREFLKKYNLGKPLAGNFFRAEYDEQVPKNWALLKKK